jgi:hypothetical protein
MEIHTRWALAAHDVTNMPSTSGVGFFLVMEPVHER